MQRHCIPASRGQLHERCRLGRYTRWALDRFSRARRRALRLYHALVGLLQASRMGRMWAIGFAPDAPDVINEKLSAITSLQVQEVAKKYLVGSHTTSAILEPNISN